MKARKIKFVLFFTCFANLMHLTYSKKYTMVGKEIKPGVISIPLRSGYYIGQYHKPNYNQRNLQQILTEGEDSAMEAEKEEESENKKRTYLGTQFAELFIGEPAIARPLAVSTKSEFTAFPCRSCLDCGSTTELFDNTASPSFLQTPCGDCSTVPTRNAANTITSCDGSNRFCYIKEEFFEKGAWEGLESRDYVYIGGAPIDYNPKGTDVPRQYGFPLNFACQSSVKGWFVTNYRDGILAMSDSKTSFINQMYEANKLAERMFSLCFGFAKGTNNSPGALTLGGTDPKYHDTPTVFCQNTQSNGESFTLYLKKIWLRQGGGMSVHPPKDNMKVILVHFDVASINKPSGVILDSSMPYTSFTNELDAGFRDAWLKATGQVYTYGRIRLLEQDLEKLPTILLQFQGDSNIDRNIDPNTVPGLVGDLDPTSPYDVLFAIPAQHYMEYNAASGFYRTRFTFTNPSGNTLGANSMQGHDICFDMGNSRVGIAESRMCKPRQQSESGAADDDLFASPVDIIAAQDEGFILPGTDGAGKAAPQGGGIQDGGVKRKFKNEPSDLDGGTAFAPNADVLAIGQCYTMLCRAFLGIGYVTSIISIFVLYKCSKMKKNTAYHIGAEEAAFFGGPAAPTADDEEFNQPSIYYDEDSQYLPSQAPTSSRHMSDLQSMVDSYNQTLQDDTRQVVDEFNQSMYGNDSSDQQSIDQYNQAMFGNKQDIHNVNESLFGTNTSQSTTSDSLSQQQQQDSIHQINTTMYGNSRERIDDYNVTMYGNAQQEIDEYNRQMQQTSTLDDINRMMYGSNNDQSSTTDTDSDKLHYH